MKDEIDNLMSFDDILSTDQHVGMEDKYEMNMNRNMNMRPIFTAWLGNSRSRLAHQRPDEYSSEPTLLVPYRVSTYR